MTTLQAFTRDECEKAGKLLAAKVATMLGRKMEEGDWGFVYCNAKQIPEGGWSNLNIDVSHDGLGVEHKMLCIRRGSSIKDVCGTTLMHPAATRSIRIPEGEQDANAVAKEVLTQYAELIAERANKVAEGSRAGTSDMRTGWLLWKELLDEFLYFEEPMVAPDPSHYYAAWNITPARGSRKATRSLWIYEKESDVKRYSVTTSAGAKIQPYFDVPSPKDKHLYHFRVQGNVVDDNTVEVWITRSTAKSLELRLGLLDPDVLSKQILAYNPRVVKEERGKYATASDLAVPVRVSLDAYRHLRGLVDYVSDEQMFQVFAQSIQANQ